MSNTAYPTVRIVAAVVDKARLTLYKPDGSKIYVEQGNPNLRRIVTEATPQLLEQGWADIHLEPVPENSYAQFEQESSGVVRFFKIAKTKLKELMVAKEAVPPDTRPMTEMSIGQVPVPIPAAAAWNGGPADEVESLDLSNKPMVVIPSSIITAAAEASERFGDDELERYRDEQEAKLNAAALAGSTDDMTGVYASTSEPTEQEALQEAIQELQQVEDDADSQRMTSAVDEILAHAMPVSDPGFHERDVGKQGEIVNEIGHTNDHVNDPDAENTIIAVVDNKVIPGVERIKSQFARAANLGSTIGVENFMKRLAAVSDQRAHSIDDLLNFLERADLPIADDGSILIYKVLKRKGDRTDGKYVDCHTKNVEQWTGAYVCMDPSMVDMNRRQECSVGLHVARRGYVRSFPGDVCVLGKLAPEDVIAVPHGEANKLRACGYHLLVELSDKQYNLVKQNRPISEDPEGKVLLANAIAGKHVRITHRVEIRGPKGSDVFTSVVAKADAPVHRVPEAPAIQEAEALPNDAAAVVLDAPVDPVGVAKEVTKAIEQQQLSRKEQAQRMYRDWQDKHTEEAKTTLVQFKKASKVSWDKLGIADPVFTMPEGVPVGKVNRKKAPNRKSIFGEKKKATKKIDFTKQEVESATVPDSTKTKEEKVETTIVPVVEEILQSKSTPAGKITRLVGIGIEYPGVAAAILQVKKAAKKSWGYFGLLDEQIDRIIELTGKK